MSEALRGLGEGWLFRQHGWLVRWGALTVVALGSIIAGFGLVAVFITPVGVRDLNTGQLLGIAGLFLMPALALGVLVVDRRSRQVQAERALARAEIRWRLEEALAEVEAEMPALLADPGTSWSNHQPRTPESASSTATPLPWVVPNLPGSRGTDDASRHRRRSRQPFFEAKDTPT